MSSTSPGDGGEKDSSDTIRKSRATGVRSSLSERVGFFEQVFSGRRRSGSRPDTDRTAGRLSRVSAGYHGPRTDARDRSSEDPRRHRIPRASLSPVSVDRQEQSGEHEQPRKRLRSRSLSKGREMDRRASRERSYDRERRSSKERVSSHATLRDKLEEERFLRQAESQSRHVHDDITPYRSIQIKRTQSGRMVESNRAGDIKPRALSFRVSPQTEDVHQPLQPIFPRTEAVRDQSMSITQHIQSKVSASRPGQYERPPPLPERPPRQHQRHSEPHIRGHHQVSGELRSWYILMEITILYSSKSQLSLI